MIGSEPVNSKHKEWKSMTITYAIEDGLAAEEFVDVLNGPAWRRAAPWTGPTSSAPWSKTPIL